MFAKQFISSEIFPLKKSDQAESALMFMGDWMVKQLPVVDNLRVLGFVSEKSLMENSDKKVEELLQTDVNHYCIQEHIHVFEIWFILYQYNLTSLAVINTDGQYVGVIAAQDIALQTFSGSSLMQEGSIIVLEMEAIQYSLAEISRICESNEAKIIHLMVITLKDTGNTLHVSIKLNKQFLTHVIASLERFGYKVIFTNSFLDSNQSFDDRYQWLVKYLNT
ncbi:MAG: CBS domain-containing protein [Bacteroidia bacterium]|nr:CBS domain-containing protein [Bacteroidia bacterium]